MVEAIYRAARNVKLPHRCAGSRLLISPYTEPARTIAQYFRLPRRTLGFFG